MFKITVVFDNYAFDWRLAFKFGFACVVETESKTILFDTGSDGEVLINNLHFFKIHPEDIDIVFISHNHWDHIGGISALLARNKYVDIYLPVGFPNDFKDVLLKKDAKVVEIDRQREIAPNIFSAGILPAEYKGNPLNEQALVLKNDVEHALITGCAHPGIVRIVEDAEKKFGKVTHLIGGFHLVDKSEEEISGVAERFKESSLHKIYPCHCSGDTARKLLKGAFEDDVVLGGVGLILEF